MSYGLTPLVSTTGTKYILTADSGASQTIGTTGFIYFVVENDVIQLPPVSTARTLLFIKTDFTGTYQLLRNGSNTIDSTASNFTANISTLLVGNGTDWVVLAATGY